MNIQDKMKKPYAKPEVEIMEFEAEEEITSSGIGGMTGDDF